ncbi:MAG TPA: hypothetical protein VE944_06795 [Nostoc sp.]|uniref:hypothetical protein n=1 Tax=Nostoc sp. TaxID=1180 RepID=UPI002D6659B4|nr:hypothetical protein [Nostoc sp.]HYX14064.1 hypothetical protein [Nostoc sp.]
MAYTIPEMLKMTRASSGAKELDPIFDEAEFWEDLLRELPDAEMIAKYPKYISEDWEWVNKFEEEDYEALGAFLDAHNARKKHPENN